MEPTEINAGDSASWSKSCPGYTPAEGWAVRYVLRGPGSLDIEYASAIGSEYRFELPASATRDLPPGLYRWAAFASRDDDRRTLDSGTLTVRPDLESAGQIEARSHAQRMLDAIEATLLKRATRDQQSYEIEGRRLDRTPIADLERLRNHYRRVVDRETANDGRGLLGRPVLIGLR